MAGATLLCSLGQAAPALATGTFNGVSCVSGMRCVAVGWTETNPNYGYGTNGPQAYVDRRSSAGWSVDTVPLPPDAQNSSLGRVFCDSRGSCTAVGSYTNTSAQTFALVERWDGSSWSMQSSVAPAGATEPGLSTVACPSSSRCLAAGSYTSSDGHTALFAERWNGSAWSLLPSPPSPSGSTPTIGGLSCFSASRCLLVGESQVGTRPYRALADRWNGHRWSVITPRSQPGSKNNNLSSVSCPARNTCIAAGSFADSHSRAHLMAQRWNGFRWSVMSVPHPSSGYNAGLFDISCPSSTACAAVGVYTDMGGTVQPLFSRWSGGRWSTHTRASGLGGSLHGVSCPGRRQCTAVGSANSYTSALGSDYSPWITTIH